MAEIQFLPFFQFQPWRKRCFCCFLLIRRGGKPIFAVFCPSYPYERMFLPFLIDCTPTKGCFRRFLSVVGVRKTVFRRFLHFVGRRRAFFLNFLALRGVGNTFFGVFCISEVSESRFLPFSTHPRPRKAIFFSFPLSRALGRSFLSVFASVAYRNLNRFLHPASCFTNDLYTL